jgi:hypothetical protein
MRVRKPLALAVAVSALGVSAVAHATITSMHAHLAAHLSGMGEHGIVNLTSTADKGRVCWTFDVPTKGITSSSIRDASGMKVVELGMHYTAKGCDTASKSALDSIESHPSRYRVWVDTKAHQGELRGKLFAGMAHM